MPKYYDESTYGTFTVTERHHFDDDGNYIRTETHHIERDNSIETTWYGEDEDWLDEDVEEEISDKVWVAKREKWKNEADVSKSQ